MASTLGHPDLPHIVDPTELKNADATKTYIHLNMDQKKIFFSRLALYGQCHHESIVEFYVCVGQRYLHLFNLFILVCEARRRSG